MIQFNNRVSEWARTRRQHCRSSQQGKGTTCGARSKAHLEQSSSQSTDDTQKSQLSRNGCCLRKILCPNRHLYTQLTAPMLRRVEEKQVVLARPEEIRWEEHPRVERVLRWRGEQLWMQIMSLSDRVCSSFADICHIPPFSPFPP